MTDKADNILIVDDEETIRRVLSKKLSSEGYECFQAANAAQALDEMAKNKYSLVILDINMPGKTGVELLPEIKSAYPYTQILMATADTDIDTAVKCIKFGAYDYVTKPFNLDEFIISVKRALEKRKLELENIEYQRNLEGKVSEQAEKIRLSFFNALASLASALEAKDTYTGGHSNRVSVISGAIAGAMRLPEEIVEKVKLAGLVHDVGKIGISEAILNKPGRLTDEEFHHVQQHPEIGEQILLPIAGDKEITRMVRSHHERYDGTGYPDRLKQEEIPLGSRIIAVADSFEAMISERPYRKALPKTEALDEIRRGRGTQFDPAAADALLQLYNAPAPSRAALFLTQRPQLFDKLPANPPLSEGLEPKKR